MQKIQRKNLKSSKILFLVILVNLVMQMPTHTAEAREICASCYWGMSCGAITTDEVAEMGLSDQNPLYEGERYVRFRCDNGRKTLGVLWTNGSCGETGGLSGIPDGRFPGIYENPHCEFGRR